MLKTFHMRIIKWLLRISFYSIFLLPLIGWLSMYLFVALTMITLKTTLIWPTDPKDTPLGEPIYDAALNIAMPGLLLCIPLLVYSIVDYVIRRYSKNKEKAHMLPTWVRIGCFTGSLLLIVFTYYDIGHYQFWLFD